MMINPTPLAINTRPTREVATFPEHYCLTCGCAITFETLDVKQGVPEFAYGTCSYHPCKSRGFRLKVPIKRIVCDIVPQE